MTEFADEAFKTVLNASAEPLRANGFRRRAHTFTLQHGNWGVLQFQKFRGDTLGDLVFTINVGLASEWLRRFEGRAPTESPKEKECHLRIRVGEFLPPYREIWWRVKDQESLDTTVREVRSALERTAIPFVLGHLQDQTLRDMWLEGKSPGITPLQRLRNLNLLLAVIGPASELPRVLEELQQMSRGHAAAVRELIARFESQIEEASSVASL